MSGKKGLLQLLKGLTVMSKIKLATLICFVLSMLAAGCGKDIKPIERKISSSVIDSAGNRESSANSVSYDEKPVEFANIKYTKFDKTIEAESGSVFGKTTVSDKRQGFKGKGYVSVVKGEQNKWELEFEAPESQFYNIILTVASDEVQNNTLTVNGESIGIVTTVKSNGFETLSLNEIFLSKGKNTISLLTDGVTDVDCIRFLAVENKNKTAVTAQSSVLSNKNADENAKNLHNYLVKNYGKKIILGQYDTPGSTIETDRIHSITGKYPAIRFSDLMPVLNENTIAHERELDIAKRWSNNGGLVGYMWHWTDPMGSGECYAEKTNFDLSKAVTKENVAVMTDEQLQKLHEQGKISDECMAIIKDIDAVSVKLKVLESVNVAVLWRPLHDASNGYFWWGRDKASYKWLWNLMYERMTEYHELNNLVWVWNAQNADWYVGDDKCDIISADIYDDGNTSGHINNFLYLNKISNKKLLAISECGTMPMINRLAQENAAWSYIGQWGGDYLLDSDSSLVQKYNSSDNLIEIYNNTLTITRDKIKSAL